MSARRRRWSHDGWYAAPEKQPVPAAGIAAGRFGDTWWGREWIAALERLGRVWSNRLPRGRSYARAGRVIDLEVGPGRVTAGVVGTRRRPYRVEIALEAFSEVVWGRAVDALAADALTVIRLLGRELPDEVGELLRSAGADLFPRRGELSTSCSCPDVANPCKHVAAVHYVFAAALDNDPFLILRLRGLDRDGLVAALAGAADAGDGGAGDAASGTALPDDDLEPAGSLDPAAFSGRDLRPPVLDIEPRPPRTQLVGVRRLGPPPRGFERLPELLAPAIRAASKRALELAWGDTATEPAGARDSEVDARRAAVAEPSRRRGRRPSRESEPTGRTVREREAAGGGDRTRLVASIERLLADARRPLSRRELVTRLGAEPADVVAALTELRRARLVASVGRGPATRYRLAPVARASRHRQARIAAPGDLADRVIEALRSANRPLALRDLAASLGAPVDTVRPVVTALRQNGVIEMVGRRRGARYRART